MQADPNALVQCIVAFCGGLPTGLTLAVLGKAFLAQHKAAIDALKKSSQAIQDKQDKALAELQELRVEQAGRICHAPIAPWHK